MKERGGDRGRERAREGERGRKGGERRREMEGEGERRWRGGEGAGTERERGREIN